MEKIVVTTADGKEKSLTVADLKEIEAGIASLLPEIDKKISKALASRSQAE